MPANKKPTEDKYKKIGSDMAKVDAYVLGPKDYEEIPELTEEWFKNATFHIGGVPVSRGRPKSAHPKEHVNLRLDPDVLAHFRAGGPGWQSRINAALRRVAKLDIPAKRKRG
jgi:uncharacterized protein (DUF4415 family)